MVMNKEHVKQSMKEIGFIQVILENGQVMVHYVLLIEQNIYLS